jgi:hypothetical protein
VKTGAREAMLRGVQDFLTAVGLKLGTGPAHGIRL